MPNRSNSKLYQNRRARSQPSQPAYTNKTKEQCPACGTFGHGKAFDCRSLPRHILMTKWIKNNQKKAEIIAAQHLAKNDPATRLKTARRMVRMNVVKAHKEDNYMFSEDIEHELDLHTFNIDIQTQE